LEQSSQVRAILSDYLTHTLTGPAIEAPKGGVSGGMRMVKWKRQSFKVEARSVFSKTGWVRRSISSGELMDVYDVGVGERKVMKETLARINQADAPLEFTHQIPVRVLMRCLEVLDKLRREGELATQKDDTHEGGCNQEKLKQTRNWEEALVKQVRLGLLSDEKRGISEEGKRQAKNDDATAQVANWNRRVCERVCCEYQPGIHDAALDKIREFELRWYRSNQGGVIKSFRRYMKSEHGSDWLERVHRFYSSGGKMDHPNSDEELVKDYEVGIDAITRALGASFWDWEEGSTVFFWRWTREHRREVRDGLRVWFSRSKLPRYWGRQRWPVDTKQREQLKEKILKVVRRRYVSYGDVRSLTSFFAVPKGIGDIRVVYDATKSGLNSSIWAPNFALPTVASVLRNADDKTFYGDIDIGEMFLNYFLDPAIRPWAGVDVSGLSSAISQAEEKSSQAKSDRKILRWERSLMGVRSSPFNCVRAYLISEEMIQGDRKAKDNPFRWDYVVFNLPGTKSYDPARPWMYRWDEVSQAIASFVLSYVDDLRTGSSKGRRDCERVTHVAGAKLNYLGEQDASRKRGEASQEPGAWAGAVIMSKEGEGLYVSISQEKWEKVQSIVNRYDKIFATARSEGAQAKVDYKQLEKDTGFLVHVFMTYELLRPYLKGFYLTLNSWRFDRGDGGWKYDRRDWEDLAEEFWNDGERWEEARDDTKRDSHVDSPTICARGV
jgi:hypothetical protein